MRMSNNWHLAGGEQADTVILELVGTIYQSWACVPSNFVPGDFAQLFIHGHITMMVPNSRVPNAHQNPEVNIYIQHRASVRIDDSTSARHTCLLTSFTNNVNKHSQSIQPVLQCICCMTVVVVWMVRHQSLEFEYLVLSWCSYLGGRGWRCGLVEEVCHEGGFWEFKDLLHFKFGLSVSVPATMHGACGHASSLWWWWWTPTYPYGSVNSELCPPFSINCLGHGVLSQQQKRS